MNDIVNQLINELDDLSNAIAGLSSPRSESLFSAINPAAPPLYKKDIIRIPQILSNKLRSIETESFDENLYHDFEEILNRLHYIRQQILPGFFNASQIPHKTAAFLSVMQWIDIIISPLCKDWERIDEGSLPKALVRKLRKAQKDFDNIVEDKEDFIKKVNALNEASPLINNISDKLGDIKDLEIEIESYKTKSFELLQTITTNKETIDSIFSNIETYKSEAEAIIKRANEAYSMATTVGLAGSFDKRALSLKVSMGLWIGGLIIALGLGAWIGYAKFEAVQVALKEKLEPGHIWILIFLSILSFGAPIWFAWLATKQIGQRFKLSEDYAFKASVAKAYEGYRKEAASIDKEMEARLFASALTRLDELPLRFMDKETHGSPWHELLNNPTFLKLFKEKPEILDKLLELAKSQLTREKDVNTES